jgi:hypothetical protein
MLERISIGWVWLERTLNLIIDGINQQKPIASSTIAVEESPNGTLLKVIPIQQGPSGSSSPSGGGAGGAKTIWPPGVGWQPMTVIDTSSGSCVTEYIWYWGTRPTGTQTPPPPNPK